jgi:hypothetical protein
VRALIRRPGGDLWTPDRPDSATRHLLPRGREYNFPHDLVNSHTERKRDFEKRLGALQGLPRQPEGSRDRPVAYSKAHGTLWALGWLKGAKGAKGCERSPRNGAHALNESATIVGEADTVFTGCSPVRNESPGSRSRGAQVLLESSGVEALWLVLVGPN